MQGAMRRRRGWNQKAEAQLWRADELLEKMEAENLMRKKEVEDLRRKEKAGELWRKKLKEELWKKEEALATEKLAMKQVEKELRELKLVLQPKELEQEKPDMEGLEELWKKEEALAKEKLKRKQVEKEKEKVEDLLKKMEEDNLLRKKEIGDLLREKGKKQNEELWTQSKALAKEKMEREQVEKELLELKLVLQQKELEQEKPDMEEPKREDSKLPQDFKIRSREISLLQEIGSGGFATIHKCQWQNYDFAVKIFEGGDVDGLRAEVQNLVLLPRHPNIVQLVGFSIHGKHDKPMLVMELLDGDLHNLVCIDEPKKKHRLTQSLSRLWKKRGRQLGLSTPIKIDFIYQIAKGMLFLHNRKIFHGDLKGKNVLVKQLPGDRIQLKIADFGLSEKLLINREHSDSDSSIELNCSHHSNNSSLGIRQVSDNGKAQVDGEGDTKVLGNVGTLRWMAPEVYGVLDGDMKPYSMKADVYSFAMTCVEILTGQHPYPDILVPRVVKRYVKDGGRPNLLMVKDAPDALLSLVGRCWDANPLLRPDFSEIYSSMQELKEQFPIN